MEVFEWLLLDYGHDDQELSRVSWSRPLRYSLDYQHNMALHTAEKPSLTFSQVCLTGAGQRANNQDSDNNTILHLLASVPSPPTLSTHTHLLRSSPLFPPRPNLKPLSEQISISLRMSSLYYTLFTFLLDWSNSGGKTALHVAAQAGNTAFINLLCDWGADVDLTDLQGNTPLHYASAWGHVETIRTLLERGSQYSSRNYEGFTASDFSYSNHVMASLQGVARELYEERKARRMAMGDTSRAGSVMEGRFRSGSTSTNISGGSGSAVSSNRLPTTHSGSGSAVSSNRLPTSEGSGHQQYQQQQYQPAPPHQGQHEQSSSRPHPSRSPSVPISPTESPNYSNGPMPFLGSVVGTGTGIRRANSAQTSGTQTSGTPTSGYRNGRI